MLTRRGVDHADLTIAATVNVDEVRIEGPKDARRAATYALVFDFDTAISGMSTAPFPDHDLLALR